jgi:hypothetical protein
MTSPGYMRFTPYDVLTGTIPFPGTSPGVDLTTTVAPPSVLSSVQGLIRYDFTDTLPANTQFGINITTDNSVNIETKFQMYGIQ